MKYTTGIILFVIALLLQFKLHGQTKKGDRLLQMNFGYISSQDDPNVLEKEKLESFSTNARMGFYLTPNFVLGFGLGYLREEESGRDYIDQNNSLDYNFEDKTVNYYLFFSFQRQLSPKLKTFINGDLNLGRGDYTERLSLSGPIGAAETYNAEVSRNEFMLRPGLMYFLNHRWVMTINYAQIGLHRTVYRFESSEKTENEEIRANFNPDSLHIGLAFFIRKKKKDKK
ncbi:MAG: hypothetical protein RIC95_05445 [Vicingaceae bacterium]